MGKSKYTPEVAELILERLASGESLRSICRDEGMPPDATVRHWVVDDVNGFAAQYARAREMQAHVLAEQLIEIADDGSNDWMERNDPDNPGYELNGEHVQRSKLRLDARKWLTSKILPKHYGDRQQVEHTGEISHVLAAMSPEERANRAKAMLERARKFVPDGGTKVIDVEPEEER